MIVTAGRTAPNKLVRFGGADVSLDERGRRDVVALRGSGGLDCRDPRFACGSTSTRSARSARRLLDQRVDLDQRVGLDQGVELVPDQRGSGDDQWGSLRCGPEVATVESVRLLGARPDIDLALTSLDVGRWDGLTPEQVPVEQLAQWFADLTSAPHGGESVADFVARIRAWQASVDVELVVVAKPVAQALLCADVEQFFATQVAPAAVYRTR